MFTNIFMANENLNSSLKYVFREPSEREENKKTPLLLLLHGFGSNEEDLIGFASYLDKRFFIASARAPFALDWGGFAWFDIRYTVKGMSVNLPQAEDSRQILLKFVDEIAETHDLDANRVFLAGFSQGAIMIYSLILTEPEKFAGAVMMSGRLVTDYLPNRAEAERLRDFPILVTHGVYDSVISIENGRAAKEFLKKLPVKLDYREYPVAHNISEESLADVANWLSERLNG